MHPTTPALGTLLADGLYAGILTATDGQPYVLVLLPERPTGRLPWRKAMDWAANLGGGADLPSRPESALLFALLKAQFQSAWHWTNEEDDASYAWYCGFAYGTTSYTHKSFEGCARAVRRLPLQSFNPLDHLVVAEVAT